MTQRNYRHRGTIQRLGTTLDSRGQRVETWSTVATVFYRRTDATGGEVIRGRQMAAESTHLIETHWIDAITAKMRLVDGSRTFHFVAVRDPFDNRQTLAIDAKETP